MLQFPILPSANEYDDALKQIEIFSQTLQYIPINAQLRSQVFHKQILKSSLFSARIEGNPLTLAQAQQLQTGNESKSVREISNVIKALNNIPEYGNSLDLNVLQLIHTDVMKNILPHPGKLRSESSAIFDQYGTIVYLTPSQDEMNSMLESFFAYLSTQQHLSWKEQLILIAASHYYFEKIHPFIDGNGRTGRVIIHYQLYKINLFKDTLIPLDEYFETHRSEYYEHLEKNTRQISTFIHFFLEGIIVALQSYLQDVKTTTASESPMTSLLPRRQEIYAIIKDHPYITLDALSRRFPTIPRRTLSYDIQQLIKSNLVVKHGTTKGVVYTVFAI